MEGFLLGIKYYWTGNNNSKRSGSLKQNLTEVYITSCFIVDDVSQSKALKIHNAFKLPDSDPELGSITHKS